MTTHATDGLLQAYLDGEIDAPAAAGLRDHLQACAVCSSELQSLQRVGSQVHTALALLDTAPPMVRAQAAIAAQRGSRDTRRSTVAPGQRTAGRSFAKAAMLLLALAGAGAAAIPESPVRRALETTIARVAQLFGAEEQVAEAPAVPVADPRQPGAMGVMPADGRVRVVLHAPAGGVDVAVRLIDTPRAMVETATDGQGVRFRTAPGRLEVSGLTAGEITIGIPRAVRNATIEIGGEVFAYKEGGTLQLTGPAGTARGEQVNFRVGY